MEELSQLSHLLDTIEDINAALKAGMTRDVNVLHAMISVQINNLSNVYTNIGTLIGVLSPDKQEEFESSALFAMNEVVHIINVIFGNEEEEKHDI